MSFQTFFESISVCEFLEIGRKRIPCPNIYLFIYLFAEEQRSKLYNHRLYKDVRIQQDLEGREHLI